MSKPRTHEKRGSTRDVLDGDRLASRGDAAGDPLAEGEADPADLGPVEAVRGGQRQPRPVAVGEVERADLDAHRGRRPVDDRPHQLVPVAGQGRELGDLVEERELVEAPARSRARSGALRDGLGRLHVTDHRASLDFANALRGGTMRAPRLVAGFGLVVLLAGCTAAAQPTDGSPTPTEVTGSVPPASPLVSRTTAPSASASAASVTESAGAGASPPPAGSPASDGAHVAVAATVLEAAVTTLDAGTLRFDVAIRTAGPPDHQITVTGHGQVSFDEPIRFRYLSDPFVGPGGSVPESEVIVEDPRLYVRGRDVSYAPPGTWLVMDFDEPPNDAMRTAALRQYGDPLFVLAPALGVTEATATGTDTIRGERTTRYAVRVDNQTALERLPEHVRDTYASKLEIFGMGGAPSTYDAEVWIDPDGRIVRIRYVQAIPSGEIDALFVTYDFEAFGAAMDLDLPSGAEVLTIEELQQRYLESGPTPSPGD